MTPEARQNMQYELDLLCAIRDGRPIERRSNGSTELKLFALRGFGYVRGVIGPKSIRLKLTEDGLDLIAQHRRWLKAK